jgi:hypothetical protein
MNYTREFAVKTNKAGVSIDSRQSLAFSGISDIKLDLPSDCEGYCSMVLTEPHYRFVTDAEKVRYPKPACAKYWSDVIARWVDVGLGKWAIALMYQVPNDFVFESPEVAPTDEDACRRVKVVCRDSVDTAWSKITYKLIAVVDGSDYPFKVLDDKGTLLIFKYAKIV